MKKLGLLVAGAMLALTALGSGASSAQAQAEGPDAVDPIYALTLTEAINSRNPDAVREHFVAGGTVVFDNSLFGLPNKTMTAAEYAARQSPNEPDVPTDIHLEIVDQSMQIGATRATWTWRETAGFLKDRNVDYLDFAVVATTQNHRFKSISLAPTQESLTRLISLAPSQESIATLPYSPAVPTIPATLEGITGMAVVRLQPVNGSQAGGAATLSATDAGGTSVSLHVRGLTTSAPAQASLHAGSYDAPGASLAALPELAVDTSGTATATGQVLFRGKENVSLATLADGEHIILVSQSGQVVAYGTVPALEVPSVGMPRTGSADGDAALLVLALALVLSGALLTRARTQA